ncbi:hypothetical protein PBI_SHEPARD_79 [Arthrobacter phage Shepard]|nr:hypothetical protein PBI_SHEPARD_79 [Arthrobacter phage Shepard]
MVSKEQREALIEVIHANGWVSLKAAEIIADGVIASGWSYSPPVTDEIDLDFNKVTFRTFPATPEQEIDMIDRIISGLPPRPEYHSMQWPPHGSVVDVQPHPSHEGIADIKIVDVASLHPEIVNEWTRIPTWDNYEINKLRLVRNRWTRRVLEFVNDGEDNEDYVEMHDKDGFSHLCHVDYLLEQTFGK